MDTNWLQLGKQALWELIGAPNRGSTGEWLLLGIAVVLLVVVFARVSQTTDIVNPGPGLPALAVIVGIVSVIVAWVVIDRWLLPMTGWDLPRLVVRGSAVLLSLLIAVPCMCLILRARPSSIVLAWGGGLLAAVIVLWLGRIGMDVAAAGSEGAQRTKARSEEMQEFLNEH